MRTSDSMNRRSSTRIENSQRPVRIVHLVRDGRAFANSYRKNRHLGMEVLPEAANDWN